MSELINLRSVRLNAAAIKEGWSRDESSRKLPVRLALLSGLCASLITVCEPALTWVAWIPLMFFWAYWSERAHLPPWLISQSSRTRQADQYRELFLGFTPRLVAMMAIPAFILILPWLMRSWYYLWPDPILSLRGFNAGIQSATYPGDSVYRYAAERPDSTVFFWVRNFAAAFLASVRVLPRLPESWTQLAGLAPLILFAISFFRPIPAALRTIRRVMMWMIMLTLIFFSLWSVEVLYFIAYVPLVGVIAAITLYTFLVEHYPKQSLVSDKKRNRTEKVNTAELILHATRRARTYALVILLAMTPLINLRLQLPNRSQLAMPPGLDYILNQGSTNDIVMTDAPWFVAWYGHRTAVWLPQRESDYDAMIARGARFDWVYIVNARVRDPREAATWWQEFADPRGWRTFRTTTASSQQEIVLRQTVPANR